MVRGYRILTRETTMGPRRSGTARLTQHLARRVTVVAAFLAFGGGPDLRAQRPEPTTLEIREVPDFSGFWEIAAAGRGFDAHQACAAIKDPSGAPMTRCSIPWEAKGGAPRGIKDFLNKRGLAWMEFRDEAMSSPR